MLAIQIDEPLTAAIASGGLSCRNYHLHQKIARHLKERRPPPIVTAAASAANTETVHINLSVAVRVACQLFRDIKKLSRVLGNRVQVPETCQPGNTGRG